MHFKDILENPNKLYTRTSWGNRNKYITLLTPECVDECILTPNTGAKLGIPSTRSYKIRPFFIIKTKYDYEFAVYVPTCEELLASDWVELS